MLVTPLVKISVTVRKIKRRVREKGVNLTLVLHRFVVYISFGIFYVALFHICQDRQCFGRDSYPAQSGSCFWKFYFFFQLDNDVVFEIVTSISFSMYCPFRNF
jgi:hypothetical protein